MTRPVDKLSVELVSGSGARGVFDNFTSFEASLDIYAPSEASFELGEDDTWQSGSDAVSPGAKYVVRLNGRPLLTGRVESNDLPSDAQAGAVVRFTIRTKLADAMYASADQKIAVKKTTLRDFLLAVYAPLGYTEDNFVFLADTARDLRTGRRSNRGTYGERLETLTVEEARVSPPEAIYAAADRHLRRFGLMHWDGPDDTIVVGFPDQGMTPIYNFSSMRRSSLNNVISATLAHDYSSVPSSVSVYGTVAARRDFSRSRVSYTAVDLDVTRAGFERPVTVVAEQIRNREAAANSAQRELSDRRQNKDKLTVEADGLSYWDGSRQVNYAQDTMCSYRSTVAGGQEGNYYVARCVLRRDARRADSAHLTGYRAGIIALFPDVFEGGSATPDGSLYHPELFPKTVGAK